MAGYIQYMTTLAQKTEARILATMAPGVEVQVPHLGRVGRVVRGPFRVAGKGPFQVTIEARDGSEIQVAAACCAVIR